MIYCMKCKKRIWFFQKWGIYPYFSNADGILHQKCYKTKIKEWLDQKEGLRHG